MIVNSFFKILLKIFCALSEFLRRCFQSKKVGENNVSPAERYGFYQLSFVSFAYVAMSFFVPTSSKMISYI